MRSQFIVSKQKKIQDNTDCEQALFGSFEWDQFQLYYLGPNFGVENIHKSSITMNPVVRLRLHTRSFFAKLLTLVMIMIIQYINQVIVGKSKIFPPNGEAI